MSSRRLWPVAALLVTFVFVRDATSDTSVFASVIDAHRSPVTTASVFAGMLASLASFTGYRSDVPWVGTDKGDLWSERQMRRASDWVSRGEGDLSRLGRTIAATLPIAALGILFYGEDSFRNFGILDAARFGS